MITEDQSQEHLFSPQPSVETVQPTIQEDIVADTSPDTSQPVVQSGYNLRPSCISRYMQVQSVRFMPVTVGINDNDYQKDIDVIKKSFIMTLVILDLFYLLCQYVMPSVDSQLKQKNQSQ